MTLNFDAPAFTGAAVTQALDAPIAATQAFAPGAVIFAEQAFVSSTFGLMDEEDHEDDCDDENCGGCREVGEDDEDEKEELDEDDLATINAAGVAAFDALNVFCDTTDVLAMVDVRKNMLKLFALYEKDSSIMNTLSGFKVSAKDAAEYLEAAVGLRAELPSVIPAGLTDEHVAQIIGVLNKYCIPLDDIRGSGLFMYVAKLTHSCTPNCNFTDSGDNIWVTAIKPIAAGETLTVDLYDLTYQSQAERTKALNEDEASCSCGMCAGTLPDKCRAFKCKDTACDGIVHPTKDVFACTKCAKTFTADQIAEVETLEVTLAEELDASTIDQLDAIIAASPLHKFHYIFHAGLTAMVEEAVEDEDLTEGDAIAIYKRILDCLEYVIDVPHGEKVSVYNSIAQMNISTGDIAAATDAYTSAYNIAQLCYGPSYEETLMFKKLMENTPKTPEEMMAVYGYELIDEPTAINFIFTAAVSHDAGVVTAATALTPGQVIFYEVAVVASSAGMEDDEHDIDCEDEDCGGCKALDGSDDEDFEKEELDDLEIPTVSSAVVEKFDELMAFCGSHEVLHMVDLSKNLFKLFKTLEDDASVLDRLRLLKVQPDAAYLDVAVALRTEFPTVVPTALTDDDVAHTIGVLHSHCHELEDIGGTGLFLEVARLEHRCIPNCNITTDGTAIWVTAIAPIAAGETLTLDTFDLFFSTNEERAGAMGMMGVTCGCDWCTGARPDTCRAFKCTDSACPGPVHPTGERYTCSVCAATFSEAEIEAAVAAEEELIEALDEVVTFAELEVAVAKTPLHLFHSVCYHALENLNSVFMQNDDIEEAEMTKLHKLALDAASYAVPFPHGDKVQHLDQLAQSYVRTGDIAAAKDAYTKALEISRICSGPECEEAAMLKSLVDNTPTNEAELMAAYGLDDECEEE
ncbi:hypothetical protein ACHHYP_13195 [Achlya hypogyna]|uniref:SET domain-containing protein n=1 Tax=Achlya hypogyna TaxID=1202772 RepID=A0A1V9ZFY7_ACHHY|nr:hypothetical protein ACHHYP_13195 [Achlya hypogyna]